MNRRQTIVYKYSLQSDLLGGEFKEAEIVDNGLRFVGSLDEEQIAEADSFAEVAEELHRHCNAVPVNSNSWRKVMMIATQAGN